MSKNRMRPWAVALTSSWTAMVLIATVLVAMVALGCASDEQGGDSEVRVQTLAQLESDHQALQTKRQELRELREEIAAGVEGIEVPEDAETTAEQMLEETQAEYSALEAEVTAEADELMSRIVSFINEDPWIEGEEKTETQAGAVRLKSSEDLVLAMEYVEEGGDYKRAGDIISRALEIDPDNQELRDRMAWIEEMRYMTEERFAEIEVGMTEAEVRAALGPPNLNNVRDFENGRVGWFYPRGANAATDGAAGVYFQRKDGVLEVYESDFNAVRPQETDEEG